MTGELIYTGTHQWPHVRLDWQALGASEGESLICETADEMIVGEAATMNGERIVRLPCGVDKNPKRCTVRRRQPTRS